MKPLPPPVTQSLFSITNLRYHNLKYLKIVRHKNFSETQKAKANIMKVHYFVKD